MYRHSLILAMLLTAVHTLAMPVHYAVGHGHELTHLDSQGNYLHVHDVECDDPAQAAPVPVRAELFDASCCGTPHHHDAHVHGATDQGYVSLRAVSIFFAACVQLPLRDAFADAVSTRPPVARADSPAPPPYLAHVSLRGPPRA